MRIAMPHVGNLYIPFRALFGQVGVDFIVPPRNTQRTLSLGVRYSPEGLCLPFKLVLGNFIEAAEMGADTLLTVGGYGICRLGYYARIQSQVFAELGYRAEIVQIGVSERKLSGLLTTIKRLSGNASWPRIIAAFRFGLAKLDTLNNLEHALQKAHPRETVRGEANRIYEQAVQAVDDADSYATLRRTAREHLDELEAIIKKSDARPLVVGLTGEIFALLEPFASLDVENELGKLGVEVRRRLSLADWTRFSLLNPLRVNEAKHLQHAARPYLKRDIGGEGWETVGEKVLRAGHYDGLVHLAPFTCMPEVVAQNIIPQTRESIPVLTILCDEQMAKPGVITRLEAFVDLLKYRRARPTTMKSGALAR